jgi:hypothetical protein
MLPRHFMSHSILPTMVLRYGRGAVKAISNLVAMARVVFREFNLRLDNYSSQLNVKLHHDCTTERSQLN